MNEFTTTNGRFIVLYDKPEKEVSFRRRRGARPTRVGVYPNLAALIDAQFHDGAAVESLEINELASAIESLGFDRDAAHILTADTLTALA